MKVRRLPPAALFAAVVLLVPSALSQDHQRRDADRMHRLHRDPEAYIAMLEDPARDAYQKPEEVLDALRIQPGETIADIGAGSGYFALRLAHRVGPTGAVYAVDISPDMIRHLNRRIRDAGVTNLISVLADPDDPLLLPDSIDRFFICDTWHHINNRADYLAKLRRMLKTGGQVVMIDFQKRELPFGPPLEMKISREDLIDEMESNGFRLSREFEFLRYQYFLIFAAE